jgi:7-cyano-7-deazaguanine synthase
LGLPFGQGGEKITDAIVVMSGGADSCICLVMALKRWKNVEAVTFDYGQRHKIELKQAHKICKKLGVPHQTIKLSGWEAIKGPALLDKNSPIGINADTGLPTTFLPGRNIIFLSYAAVVAYQRGCNHIVTGVCQTDYSGYPDCRDSSIKALQGALTLGMDYDINIHTPLMWLTKAESIKRAEAIGALPYLALTQTCYEGKRPACGVCPACKLRIAGFKEAKIRDPIDYEIDIDWSDCE